MCLTVDNSVSKKFNKDGTFVAYKVFELIKHGKALSPMHYNKWESVYSRRVIAITKDGYYVSDRKSAKKSRSDYSSYSVYTGKTTREIGKGIHVFLFKKGASEYKKEWGHLRSGMIIVPVLCNKKDLVAFGKQEGSHQAVFLKVKILYKKHCKMCKVV